MQKALIITCIAAALLFAVQTASAQVGTDEAVPGVTGSPSMSAPGGATGANDTREVRPANGRDSSDAVRENDLGAASAGQGPKSMRDEEQQTSKETDRQPGDQPTMNGTSEKRAIDQSTRDLSNDRQGKSVDKTGRSAKIDDEQKGKVRNYFSANKPEVKRVEKNAVSVSIGMALPSGIAIYSLPASIVVVAGDCPIQYFVWGDDIVLVDSCSRLVVDIIPGVA
jgi:hypothetical protein